MTFEFQTLEHEWQWAEAARLSSQFWPEDPINAELLQVFAREFPADKFSRRTLAISNGVAVAYIRMVEAYWLGGETNRFNFQIAPERGSNLPAIYEACLDHALEVAAGLPQRVAYSTIRSDDADITAIVTQRGFTKGQVNPVSALHLTDFAEETYADKLRVVKESGYEILNLGEFQARYPDDWSRRFYEADMEVMKDVPMPEPFQVIPYETYRNMIESPSVTPEGYVLALAGEEVAAFTELNWNRLNPSIANTGLTGVRREHRRKGLATAVKATSLAWARSIGIEKVFTDNEENNPMYQLNLALGYKWVRDLVDYAWTKE